MDTLLHDKKYTKKHLKDLRAISMNMTLPCILTNNKKHPVINFRNPEGWERYKIVSEEHTYEIKYLLDNIKDINKLRVMIHIANMEIQEESFGITWEGASKQMKKSKRDSKEIKELFLEQQKELDELIEVGANIKDLNRKMYRLKDLIKGPKINP